jgi:hypothetical protein
MYSFVPARAVDVPPAPSAVPSDSSIQRCDWFGLNERRLACLAPAALASKSGARGWAPDGPGIRSRGHAHSAGLLAIGVLPGRAETRSRRSIQPGWTPPARPHATTAWCFFRLGSSLRPTGFHSHGFCRSPSIADVSARHTPLSACLRPSAVQFFRRKHRKVLAMAESGIEVEISMT